MAYTTINKSTDYFNTKLYTGNGSTQTISSVGFQPDFTWIKHRDGETAHLLFDYVRGALKRIQTNTTNSESTLNNSLTSWNSDGFALGTENDVNGNSRLFASWNWKANGSGSANTDGSISSTVSANTTSGFSIVKYTGTGSAATIGHGLGVSPACIIFKDTSDSGGVDWFVYHQSTGATKRLKLNQTVASATSSFINNTTPSSTVFNTEGGGATGTNANNFIAYCFAEKQGYSKFGSFVGSSNQQFIYTGFKPRWFMWKNTSQGSSTYDHWGMVDTSRQTPNGATDGYMRANQNLAESSFSGNGLFFLSNGIQFNNTGRYNNNSGDTYIYMAFAEQPLVGDNPATAR